MIELRTTFNPFKLRIKRREPIILSVELVNTGQETEIVSFEMNLGSQFSLEKSGFKNTASEKIPKFEPGESKKYYYDVWAKQAARPGEQPIKVAVIEHYNGFNYVKRKNEKTLHISVEE